MAYAETVETEPDALKKFIISFIILPAVMYILNC